MKFVILLTMALVLAACGGDSGGMSAEAVEGSEIAQTSGCAACHGSSGEGGIGPAWVGLYGSEIELADGTTVVADEAYLRESIVDPQAKIRAGYEIAMPENPLTDDEVEKVLEYIKALG